MKRDEVHGAWAPDAAAWTGWVKPVLFGCMTEDVDVRGKVAPASWLSAKLLAPLGDVAETAAVVDLHGTDGVEVGLALADHGFRPLPLYNAVQHAGAFVDMRWVMAALVDAAPRVATVSLTAPPAFLLDSRRMTRAPVDRTARGYDNRWVVRATDFPTAAWLKGEGIRRILLVQATLGRPASDLAVVLETWQAAGLQLFHLAEHDPAPASLFTAKRSWSERVIDWFASWPQRRADGAYGRFWVQSG